MSALSPRQMFLLDSACAPLMEVFGWATYLVGTAMETRDGRAPRDIDVRTIVKDKQYDRLTKAIGPKGVAFLGIAVGQYLASLTGLPIDYQLQRRTEANALHKGVRNPLGHRSLSNYKGDAQTVDMERLLAAVAESKAEEADHGPKPSPCTERGHSGCEIVVVDGQWWTIHHPAEGADR